MLLWRSSSLVPSGKTHISHYDNPGPLWAFSEALDNDGQYPDTTAGAQQQGPILDPIDTDLAKVFQLHRVPPLGVHFFLSCKSLTALLPDGASHLESQGQP